MTEQPSASLRDLLLDRLHRSDLAPQVRDLLREQGRRAQAMRKSRRTSLLG
ncbi:MULTISPECIES: hypothetical protein [Streptomyces]|uniref:Uncharacterized protein n=1 Tax=Streptomyces heilongjiangensis TaxID=945052 RepID=A0ABW1B369_9ACTN|nr:MULTISPECIES: hypothetical protein [Streptomyces]MDC2946945.1 hypothetical protein [Streptomyces heilongjiangensis]